MFRNVIAVMVVLVLGVSQLLAQSAVEKQAQGLIDKGHQYLKANQSPDGSWQTADDPPGMTALVLRSFVVDPRYTADTDFIAKGFTKLLSYQKEDGGIYVSAQGNYNTAVALSAMAGVKNPKFKPNIDKALKFLRSTQWLPANSSAQDKIEDDKNSFYGGWGYATATRGLGRPDLSNTQLALDALRDAGLKSDDPAFQAAIKFASRTQNLSETNDLKWAGNDGGFIYTLNADGTARSGAGEYAGADGKPMHRSYGSMTYAGLKTFVYADLKKDDPRVKAAWDWISKNWTLDENPGMRAGNPANAQFGLYYYFHTLGRALDLYDQPIITDPQGKKHDWRVEFVQKLASLQKPDGSWAGEQRWMEDDAKLVTAYCVMAIQETVKDLKEHPPTGN